MGLSDAA